MEKDGSIHSSSSTVKVKEESATTQAKEDRLDKSLEDEFKRIASSTDRDKLQKKYDKLKRIYLKLKQKYVEKEEQKRQETAKRPPEERIEIVTIKDEPEDFDLPVVSNTSAIEKKNLTRITPKTKQSREYAVPAMLPKDEVVEETDEEQCTGQTVRGMKTGGRRKSSRPRKKEEKDEENGEGMKLEDDVDNEDYLPLNSEPEDDNDNDEPWLDGDDVDMNDEDEPEKKKRKKTRSKPELRIKLKDKIKNKEKKEAQVFRCDICGKFLSSRPILEKHHRIHTGERPYQCHICGKSFNSLSSFNNHTRIHNGIKPYKCRHCDKCFTETSQRTTHERTHTGEKPYMCDLCGGRFSLRSSLVRHRRIHTGEKPYVCSECGAAYCQYTQLSHHKKKCGRIPSLPTMTPLHFMSDLSDTPFQGSLAEHKSKQCDSTEEKQDKPDTIFDGQKQIKVEKMTDTSKLAEPSNKDDSDHKAGHCVSGSSPHRSESFSPPFVQNMGERDVRLQNSFSNFQHFQPYVHALNHPVGNISAFPSPEVVAREAMERFTSMHPSWFVNNTQSG